MMPSAHSYHLGSFSRKTMNSCSIFAQVVTPLALLTRERHEGRDKTPRHQTDNHPGHPLPNDYPGKYEQAQRRPYTAEACSRAPFFQSGSIVSEEPLM